MYNGGLRLNLLTFWCYQTELLTPVQALILSVLIRMLKLLHALNVSIVKFLSRPLRRLPQLHPEEQTHSESHRLPGFYVSSLRERTFLGSQYTNSSVYVLTVCRIWNAQLLPIS